MKRSTEELRGDALAAFDAAVDAVRPERLIPSAVANDRDTVSIHGEPLPEGSGRRAVVALGKAAPGLAEAWVRRLPEWADEVIVLTPHGVPVSDWLATRAEVWRGAHPYPDSAGEASARRLLALTDELAHDDLLVVLLSGGASALLAAPAEGITLEEVRETTRLLLEAGAPIGAVNTVRRQLLEAGGGGLASHTAPAAIVSLVLSDVLGSPLPDIASGPTVPSPTSAGDAVAVLERYRVADRLPAAVMRTLLDRAATPDVGPPRWTWRSSTSILADNRTAVEGAATALAELGYEVAAPALTLTGEASERGRELAALARALCPPTATALVLGGETTVTVRGHGRGGRNQELALAAATVLDGVGLDCALLAAGTDGVDGLSENAGALVDPTTALRLRAAGLDSEAALAANDSATVLEAVGDALVTGPTGTNVCDLAILLVAPGQPPRTTRKTR